MLRSGALLLAVATACGQPASVAYQDLEQALQQARCEQLTRCKIFPDEAACMMFSRALPNTSIAAAINDHKIDYNGERAKQCVDATAKLSCDQTAHDVHIASSACTDMYVGRVADGDRCFLDAECASGTCEVPTATCPEIGCCAGTCRATRAPGAAGDACTQQRDCRDGLICGHDRTCHAPAAAGVPCQLDRECGDGLACVEASGDIAGTCRALPHAGEPCSFQRCAEQNLRCDPDTHLCTPVGLPGDPCPKGIECSIDMECDATTHLCREFPTLGMACDGTCIDESYCAPGPAGGDGTCLALLPNNQPCDGDQQCVSGFCEDGPVFRGCIDPYVCF
jgi:hypothetical protein